MSLDVILKQYVDKELQRLFGGSVLNPYCVT